ncbi:TRAP transporter substrate-binding protein [Ammoniphilus resinae]|uniref:Tripartite ATP-independent transporter DctP family solute receptor n=1 Tax=Ammoniphilus resinae TaxID=861532 RepID=A0ABS4GWR1_9BACL|nr:TRAP transporter substrate-binding protein [Ammoniphilus resinae]MBP1934701.1 tripartite ATP-independent transporter DctP family solute receptor [Ammoniphilus resinae]
MINKKYFLSTAIFSMLALSLVTGCGGSTSSSSSGGSNGGASGGSSDNQNYQGTSEKPQAEAPKFEKMTIKFGHSSETSEPTHKAALAFAEKVKERTGGAVEVKVYPAEQIGVERDMIEQTKSGAIQLVFSSPGALGVFNPEIEIFNGPFLWDNWDQAKWVMRESDLGKEVYANLEKDHGLKVLDPAWYWGWRHITANKEIRTPADMVGQKFRVSNVPIFVEMGKAMGASPTPINFSEVYTALQQGVVDSQENPIPTIWAKKFYEVQDYVMMSGHMLQSNHVTANAAWFNGLSPELQQIIQEEITAAGDAMTEMQMEAEISDLEKIKAEGVKIIEDVDKKAFEEATRGVYDLFADKWGADLYDRVQKAKSEFKP